MTGIGLPTSPGGGPLEAGPGGGSLRVDPGGALKSGPGGISSPPFRPQAERLSAARATIPNRTIGRQKNQRFRLVAQRHCLMLKPPRGEARQIAVNIAKLPLKRPAC